MRDILDPADIWLGTPGGATVFGNKRPVALDDALTVLKDSGPVTVDVLANDFDPEGAALTLVSASAALGSAVAEADNTVTYTPPNGIAGFDTVVYEIADDLNQRRTAQINVTITEAELTISTEPDNTLVVNAGSGTVDITVTEPPVFAGSYQIQIADLAGGPVNLVPPAISGTLATGEILSATGGLWVFDTGAGTPTQSWQWQRNSADISGATSATYAVTAADLGQAMSTTETRTDVFGQRTADSTTIGATFTPANDPQLIGWWDASDTASISASGGNLLSWADKAGGAAFAGVASPVTGARTLNGLNVIDFGNGAYCEVNRTFPASGDLAIHMVLEVDSVGNAFEAILAVEATNDFQIDANANAQFDGRLNAAGISASVGLSGGPFSGPIILSAVFDRTGAATAEIFVANALRASTGYTTAIDATAALHLMANRTRNAWIDGAVAEVVVTGDISNRSEHHAYLAGKWGLV